MTIPHSADAPLLLTDADVLARVQALVGRAITDRQLWIMFVDGDNRQAPVVMPVSDMPRHPPPACSTAWPACSAVCTAISPPTWVRVR
jgi:hypothetical protein